MTTLAVVAADPHNMSDASLLRVTDQEVYDALKRDGNRHVLETLAKICFGTNLELLDGAFRSSYPNFERGNPAPVHVEFGDGGGRELVFIDQMEGPEVGPLIIPFEHWADITASRAHEAASSIGAGLVNLSDLAVMRNIGRPLFQHSWNVCWACDPSTSATVLAGINRRGNTVAPFEPPILALPDPPDPNQKRPVIVCRVALPIDR